VLPAVKKNLDKNPLSTEMTHRGTEEKSEKVKKKQRDL
jgi:hypothetical protein